MRFWSPWSWIVVIGMMVFASCAKKDETPPVIIISNPGENAVFDIYDTVHVQFSVSDETELVSASIKIVNTDFIPVTASISVTVSGNQQSGSGSIVIDDKQLPSADYFVLVSASDGTNDQLEYVAIRINEIPKARRAIYFADANGSGMSNIMLVDSLFQAMQLFVFPGQDVLKVTVNSDRDQLSLIGHFSTGIKTYSLQNHSLLWQDETFSLAQTPRYNDLFIYGNSVYTSLYDRELRAYNSSGSLTMNLNMADHRPQTIYADANYVLVEKQLIGTENHVLDAYHAATRAYLWRLELPMDLVSICRLQSDQVLLFGNDGGQAKVLQYDIGDNGYWEPRQLPAGKVLAAAKMDGLTFAIAHGSGLYAYTYSPNYLNQILPGSVFQTVVFDEDNGVLIAAEGNMLKQLSASGQVLNTLAHSDSILSVAIHYTK